MKQELLNEWKAAEASAVLIEDRMNPDGETIDLRNVLVKFRNREVTVLSKRRPESGKVSDAKLDPAKGPKYLVSIFIKDPNTGTLNQVRNVPQDSPCPNAERLVALLEALGGSDRISTVAQRRAAEFNEAKERFAANWTARLANTDFTDEERKLFVDHALTALGNRTFSKRAEQFIDCIATYHKQIICKDLDACGVVENNPKRLSFTLADVMYNIICQCLERKMKTDHGDDCIPLSTIQNRFWMCDDGDVHMSPYVRAVRATLREIYTFCHERPTTFTFIIIGIAKYFEAITGESVQLRIAANDMRRKERAARQDLQKATGSSRPRGSSGRTVQLMDDKGEVFGNIGHLFDN